MEAPGRVQAALDAAVADARPRAEGAPAAYIPELANVPPDRLSAAVTLVDGTRVSAGDAAEHRFTLQSSAKLVVLAGLLEERGPEAVFRVVGTEPSGGGFASVARLETHGPLPSNPLVNPGAIALCGLLRGTLEERVAWVRGWAERLCGEPLAVDEDVRASERATAARNRAIAWTLRHGGVLEGDVEETLEVYFTLCSLRADAAQASRLPAVLAGRGLAPGGDARVLSEQTVCAVVALMATCGMYDESGAYLVETGLPAKSGVSGVIVAVAPGRAGVAVSSPRLNPKGGSVRGHAVLRDLSRRLGWHLALAGG